MDISFTSHLRFRHSKQIEFSRNISTRLTFYRYNKNMFAKTGQCLTGLVFSYISIQHRFSTLLQSPINNNTRKLFWHSIIQTLENSFQFWKKLKHRSATVIKIWLLLSIYVCSLIGNFFPKFQFILQWNRNVCIFELNTNQHFIIIIIIYGS